MKRRSICCLFPLIVTTILSSAEAHTSDYFTAAVYEHARQGNLTTDTPESIIQTNLFYYERATAAAKEQAADLILFPEYGIFPPSNERGDLKSYVEIIPNPKEVLVTPCDEAHLYSNRPILLTLSCMAKNNNIAVVANVGGRQSCSGEQDCPDDGEFHFNANVAFDKHGTLIGRYYKERLFYELGMDLPREKQDPIVETDFGRFATFICFDMIFERMAVVSRLTDVDAILFSTMWVNYSPFYTSIQWWQAWAMGNDATLLASNIQLPGFLATGSGVYRGREGQIVSAFNPDGISKLIIANVPKRGRSIFPTSKILAITENEIQEWNNNSKDLPRVCSFGVLGVSRNVSTDYRCFDENLSNYTIKKLTGSEGHVKVCNNGMCCELDYSADSMNESYYLGVFNGTRPFFERYFFSEEVCFLARCDDFNGTSCATFAMYSDTVFRRISMKANFSTEFVYPSLMSSGMESVPVRKWNYNLQTDEASTEFNSRRGIRLLQATLLGRVYDKDPPYVR